VLVNADKVGLLLIVMGSKKVTTIFNTPMLRAHVGGGNGDGR
jgi:hypothetical protein